jgi:hypothetical protein
LRITALKKKETPGIRAREEMVTAAHVRHNSLWFSHWLSILEGDRKEIKAFRVAVAYEKNVFTIG